ncbi:MAG: DUF3145 domain-containing protein [Propionibacteriaceae bacterium]|jgi:adhesin HecA-like repeat protein|nr:DUF3145 domain-containing protein [Propionibacteriaceae bacterium]
MAVFGVARIHSASAAMRPHVEWACARALGRRLRLEWLSQPARPGTFRADFEWRGELGTGERLASALKACGRVSFEVAQDPVAGCDGMRWTYTPSLGLHAAQVDQSGGVVIGEQRLRAALEGASDLRRAIEGLLGSDWDGELEALRMAGGAVELARSPRNGRLPKPTAVSRIVSGGY